MAEKNWLFSNSARGAKSSVSLYSIIETAKANDLIVEKYLVYFLDALSNREIKSKEFLLDVMPSSKKLPKELKVLANK